MKYEISNATKVCGETIVNVLINQDSLVGFPCRQLMKHWYEWCFVEGPVVFCFAAGYETWEWFTSCKVCVRPLECRPITHAVCISSSHTPIQRRCQRPGPSVLTLSFSYLGIWSMHPHVAWNIWAKGTPRLDPISLPPFKQLSATIWFTDAVPCMWLLTPSVLFHRKL